MADAAVEFLLDNLQQLLLYHIDLIKGAKDDVETLEKDLRLFKAFLKDSTKKRRKNERFRELIKRIRDVVYNAEDVIDDYVTKANNLSERRNPLINAFRKPNDLLNIAKSVKAVSSEVSKIYGERGAIDFACLDVADGGPEDEQLEAPILREENVVGFEDEAEKITGYLNEKTQHLDVITIIGMPGLGKTTLAGKIFNDRAIHYEFPTRIWIYISQTFTKKDIFITILRKFNQKITDEISQKSDQELARLVSSHLENGKFLMVLDDVWTAGDWEKLKVAFPKKNNMGKILITSRNEEVAQCANLERPPHRLRFLTEDESWLLLQWEAFGKPECPHQDLEKEGKLIAKRCGGLPLAIVVIGGILVKKVLVSDEICVKRDAWKKVSENVGGYLNEDPDKRMENIIALSYDKLPYHLRACFLYFGVFPEDFEIPVWNLIRLWIAEGFIQNKRGNTLEETAENYLDDLINRNLIRVDKRKPNGRAKTCRIHDMLRDFCISEARSDNENFLQEIMMSDDGGFETQVPREIKYRRLCIHTNIPKFISLKCTGPHVRSFACFSKEEITLEPQNISVIPAAFKLLRVLEAKPIKFNKIPREVYKLVHLRYITLSFNLGTLPPHFSKLWNLQTLIINTTFRELDIIADIWKIVQLRHLKTNAIAILPKLGKTSNKGENLQTLSAISPQSCTKEVFEWARNLKNLGIRGRLSFLLQGNSEFDSMVKLLGLEKLKLLNDVLPSLPLEGPSEGQLLSLPQHYKFPPNLKSLTLSKTSLSWNEMSVLGLLENLEVLKLKEKAFVGDSWKATDGGFRRLEVLRMERMDLAEWVASGHHFPRLRRLELKNCEVLKVIPIGLAESLRVLDLYRSNKAIPSAYKIEKKKMMTEEKKASVGGFKLIIFPPEESTSVC